MASSTAIYAGSALTVDAGATLSFDSTAAGAPISGSPLAVTAVPEPAALALLFTAALLTGAVAWRRRKGQ